jgi:hypothetical protein
MSQSKGAILTATLPGEHWKERDDNRWPVRNAVARAFPGGGTFFAEAAQIIEVSVGPEHVERARAFLTNTLGCTDLTQRPIFECPAAA